MRPVDKEVSDIEFPAQHHWEQLRVILVNQIVIDNSADRIVDEPVEHVFDAMMVRVSALVHFGFGVRVLFDESFAEPANENENRGRVENPQENEVEIGFVSFPMPIFDEELFRSLELTEHENRNDNVN